jgi:hypothetical protein
MKTTIKCQKVLLWLGFKLCTSRLLITPIVFSNGSIIILEKKLYPCAKTAHHEGEFGHGGRAPLDLDLSA